MMPDDDRFFSNLESVETEKSEFYIDLFKRNDGIISVNLKNSCVLVVGAGSVGSYISEKLVRAGVGNIILVDNDIVEAHNLTRTVYDNNDVGSLKVEALSKRLKSINPYLDVEFKSDKFENIPKNDIRKFISQCDLIYSAADTLGTQAILNKIAFFHKKPLVRCGIFQGGELGEAAYIYPGVTPCLKCVFRVRFQSESVNGAEKRKVSYEDGRLESTIGLGCDVHYVSNVAARITLAILTMKLDTELQMNHTLLKASVKKHSNLIMFSMSPDHSFFNDVFKNISGQIAYQSIWVESQFYDDCDVCGEAVEFDYDPIDDIQALL